MRLSSALAVLAVHLPTYALRYVPACVLPMCLYLPMPRLHITVDAYASRRRRDQKEKDHTD